MPDSRHSRLSSPAKTGTIAEHKGNMHAIPCLTAHDAWTVISQRETAQTTKWSNKDDTIFNLADRVVSEERPAVIGKAAERETSVTVNTANIWDAITAITYLIKDSLAAKISPEPKDGNT